MKTRAMNHLHKQQSIRAVPLPELESGKIPHGKHSEIERERGWKVPERASRAQKIKRAGIANAPKPISARSRKNLLDAMHGEAFACAKYQLFAQHAKKSGNLELAELFAKVAGQEYFEHFTEEAELLGLVGSDERDLHHAIAGESYEVETMYKQFAEQAHADGDVAVAERFDEIRRDEVLHRIAFQDALTRLQTREWVNRKPEIVGQAKQGGRS
jgi:rubrerythrin